MPITDEFGDSVKVGVLLKLARELAKNRRHEECYAVYTAAVRLDGTPMARNEFGCYLLEIDRADEAIDQFSSALDCALRLDDKTLRAMVCSNLAAAYRAAGCVETAAAFQQRSIPYAGDFESEPSELSCDLSNRACDALLAGEYDLAEQLLCRALLLDVQNGSINGQAAVWGNLGVLYGKRGESRRGVQCLRQAFRLHKKVRDVRGLGMDLLNLAELLEHSGQLSRAIEFLRKAIRHFEKARSDRLLRYARTILSNLQRCESLERQNPLLN